MDGGASVNLDLQKEFLYTIRFNVASLVHPKIFFQVDLTLDPQRGETPIYTLDQKIVDAEHEITRRLGARYKLPLAVDRDAFLLLPPATQCAIREVTDMMAAAKLLGLSHGANSPSDGEKFQGTTRSDVEKSLKMLLDMTEQPLEGLEPINTTTDDARPAGSILSNKGLDVGLGTGPCHPVDYVLARLPGPYPWPY